MAEDLGFIRTLRNGKKRSAQVDPSGGIDTGKLAVFIASANVINTALARAKETAHAILDKNPNSFGGSLYLGQGGGDAALPDTLAAYKRMQRLAREAGQEVDAREFFEKFLRRASITPRNLQDFARELTGREEPELRAALDPLIKRKQRTPSLRIRGA